MIERIILALLANLGPWLLAKALEKRNKTSGVTITNETIDQRLSNFKAAYQNAFDGKEVTPEQRKKLNQAISDFLRSDPSGGM